jgi:hypothetical protein
VHDGGGHLTADKCVVEGVDGQGCRHAGVHGVADDPLGTGILDGAETELAFVGCSLISVSHSVLISSALKSRWTRSS